MSLFFMAMNLCCLWSAGSGCNQTGASTLPGRFECHVNILNITLKISTFCMSHWSINKWRTGIRSNIHCLAILNAMSTFWISHWKYQHFACHIEVSTGDVPESDPTLIALLLGLILPIPQQQLLCSDPTLRLPCYLLLGLKLNLILPIPQQQLLCSAEGIQ